MEITNTWNQYDSTTIEVKTTQASQVTEAPNVAGCRIRASREFARIEF